MSMNVDKSNIGKVLAVYGSASFVVLQVIDLLEERLALPDWMFTGALVLLLIGLPILITTALVQANDFKSALIEKNFTWRRAIGGGIAAFVVLALAAGGYVMTRTASTAADGGGLSVAALPFANMSSDQEDSYFTDGFHDELLTQLSKIGSMRVISRTSVLGYKGTTKNLKTIADELGVRYILEGSVQRFGERVKITAQLIDSRDDTHVWAEAYERSRADLFAIQAEVATAIAHAMNVELSPKTKASLAELPTRSPQAHDYYLRAIDYGRTGGAAALELQGKHWALGASMLEKAVAADPDFALAYAELGFAHLRLYWFGFDKTDGRRALGKQAIDRALELDPKLPQARSALGYYYYWGLRDYDRALSAFTAAQADFPGTSELKNLTAYVVRRQGRFNEAAALLKKSVPDDPRNSFLVLEVGRSYYGARNDEEAIRWIAKARSLTPDYPMPYSMQVDVALGQGNLTAARAAVRDALSAAGPAGEVLLAAYRVEMTARSYDQALRYAEQMGQGVILNQDELLVPALLKGIALQSLGRDAEAREQLLEARRLLEAENAKSPDNYRILQPLARTYAALGERALTIKTGQHAVDLLPISKDAVAGAFIAERVAQAYAMIGDAARASDLLSLLNTSPAITEMRPALLRIDPRFDPIRNSPEFQRVVQ